MKCIKCTEKNINKANYCKKCAYKFSKKEQEIARKHTIIGKLDLLEKAYKTCNLQIITDHILFKIFSLLIVLALGINIWINYGLSLKLLNSDEYQIQYNTKLDEYYLISEKHKVPLNLYVPNRVKNIVVRHYSGGQIINRKTYKKEQEIILNATSDDYYTLQINYLYGDKDNYKIYVYEEE